MEMVNAAFSALLLRGGGGVPCSAFAFCQSHQFKKGSAWETWTGKAGEAPRSCLHRVWLMWLVPRVCSTHLPCFPRVQCVSAVQQRVLCDLGVWGCVLCVSSVVCTWAMHQGFVSHTYSSARSSTLGCHCTPPQLPSSLLQPCPAGLLSWPAAAVWRWRALLGCQPVWLLCNRTLPAVLLVFQGWKGFLCPIPPPSTALGELKPCRGWPEWVSGTAGMADCSHASTPMAAGEMLRVQEHVQLGWDRTVASWAKSSALSSSGRHICKKPKSKARLLIVRDVSHCNSLGL